MTHEINSNKDLLERLPLGRRDQLQTYYELMKSERLVLPEDLEGEYVFYDERKIQLSGGQIAGFMSELLVYLGEYSLSADYPQSKRLGGGVEGSVIRLDDRYVAKISYSPNNVASDRYVPTTQVESVASAERIKQLIKQKGIRVAQTFGVIRIQADGEVPPRYVEIQIIENLERMIKGSDFDEQVKRRVIEIFPELASENLPKESGLLRDPHWDNFMYDTQTDEIILIDQ